MFSDIIPCTQFCLKIGYLKGTIFDISADWPEKCKKTNNKIILRIIITITMDMPGLEAYDE